jgi:hypothetical protein
MPSPNVKEFDPTRFNSQPYVATQTQSFALLTSGAAEKRNKLSALGIEQK